jgi:hypothetical protein
MDNLIARIIEIDGQAKTLTDEAKSKVAGFDKALRGEIDDMRLMIEAQAEKRIAANRETEEARSRSNLKALIEQFEGRRADLLTKREGNLDRWADEVWEKLINANIS